MREVAKPRNVKCWTKSTVFIYHWAWEGSLLGFNFVCLLWFARKEHRAISLSFLLPNIVFHICFCIFLQKINHWVAKLRKWSLFKSHLTDYISHCKRNTHLLSISNQQISSLPLSFLWLLGLLSSFFSRCKPVLCSVECDVNTLWSSSGFM